MSDCIVLANTVLAFIALVYVVLAYVELAYLVLAYVEGNGWLRSPVLSRPGKHV